MVERKGLGCILTPPLYPYSPFSFPSLIHSFLSTPLSRSLACFSFFSRVALARVAEQESPLKRGESAEPRWNEQKYRGKKYIVTE